MSTYYHTFVIDNEVIEDVVSTATNTATVNFISVPSGGTTGQALTKASSTNYDVEWTTPVGTNLTVGTATATTLDINSSTGTDITVPAATTSNAGLFTAAEKVKLSGIATSATANSSDATLLARANHTGTQLASTISDFTSATNTLVTSGVSTHNSVTSGAHGISVFGATLVDDADAYAARTTLGLGSLATQSGTFSGTSSGINTGDTDTRLRPVYETDFLVASSFGAFTGSAISTGTNAGTVPTASIDGNHMGVTFYRSSATPNSGYRVVTTSDIQISGGEVFDAIFYTPSPFTTKAARLGFFDVFTTSAPVDGCWLSVDGSGVAQGNNSSNSSATATVSTFTLSVATYYHSRITVNAGATSVLYEIYTDAGTLLWSDTLATSIPTGSGRTTACGCMFTSSGSSAVDLYGMDYMRVSFGTVQRGALT